MSDASINGINVNTDAAPVIITTQPDHILRHSISDEELDMLCDSRTDMVLELLLISVGAILGTLPAAVHAIISYFGAAQDAPAELGLTDFIQIILFCSGVFVAVCIGIIFNKKSKRSVSLRDQIRNRTKDSRDT
jgi:hypothetical protein